MPRSFRSESDGTDAVRQLDVRPDDVDGRDYAFAPSLRLLPVTADPRARRAAPAILNQGTEGACVGFALAAVINASLRRRGEREPVSQRMLYEMARRYDEWRGEHESGTSLRGAMKGWHHHGVCSAALWPYRPGGSPGHLTARRAADACARPLGAYFRILDSDVSHMQAAIVEADAALASAWVHSGWKREHLDRPRRGDRLGLPMIPHRRDLRGLHAFALVGYGPEGFVVQNSWGSNWGHRGLAILSYDDWFENRQDAWVARPGPPTRDSSRRTRIFLGPLGGASASGSRPEEDDAGPAGASGVEGLGIDREALPYIINTGPQGLLSGRGRMETARADLPDMAARVRLARARRGVRDVLLYAHGGLVRETEGARTAARLWSLCREVGLTAYFFVWETGFTEAMWGWIRGAHQAAAPRTGFDLGAWAHRAGARLREAARAAQRKLGEALAPLARAEWGEMQQRAAGAGTGQGGAALFVADLLKAMAEAGGDEPFRLHLMGHSAGSIYLARLYEGTLDRLLRGSGRTRLGTIQFMAPALGIPLARRIFAPGRRLPVDRSAFSVTTLDAADEDSDGIVIYPSSLLTYVADHLEAADERVPILGLASDFAAARAGLGSPALRRATASAHHGEFDDPDHEVDQAIRRLAGA